MKRWLHHSCPSWCQGDSYWGDEKGHLVKFPVISSRWQHLTVDSFDFSWKSKWGLHCACVVAYTVRSSEPVRKKCVCLHEGECLNRPVAPPPPAVCRSSTPTCREWAASTTGCPSPCPPWTCSASESRCNTKPKRNSTSSSSSTTSAAGECRGKQRRRRFLQRLTHPLVWSLFFFLLLLPDISCQETANSSFEIFTRAPIMFFSPF